MKIFIIVDDFLPSSVKITAKMMRDLSAEFIALGHDVTVITPSNTTEIIINTGVTILTFKSGKTKNVSKSVRLLNEFLFPLNAIKAHGDYLYANPHDLIIFWSPSIFWSGLVRRLKNKWSAPAYMLLRDFFPQWVIDGGIIKERSIAAKILRYFELLNYKSADVMALQSPRNIEWFSSLNTLNKPLVLLYNWCSGCDYVEKSSIYRNKYKLSGKIVYFYGGNVGHAQDMMNIVRLAKNMTLYEQAYFVIVGSGDEFLLIQRAINSFNLKNILLLPAIPHDEFLLMLSEFDVGLFSLHKDHKSHNFPGKLLSYMVQGLPILGSVNYGNDLKDVVENSGAGFVSITGDDDAFFANAVKLLNDETRLSMGIKSMKLRDDLFSVEAAARGILDWRYRYKKIH